MRSSVFHLGLVFCVLYLLACADGVKNVSQSEINRLVIATTDTLITNRTDSVKTENVLTNDIDKEETNKLEITEWTNGSKGTVTYDGGGIFIYEPLATISSGDDIFTYTVVNGNGTSAVGEVQVQIQPSWGDNIKHTDSYSGYKQFISKSGDVFLFYDMFNTTLSKTELMLNRFNEADKVWLAPEVISGDFEFYTYDIFQDPNDHIMVVFLARPLQMKARRYNSSTDTWETTKDLGAANLNAFTSSLFVPKMDELGNMIVLWDEPEGGGSTNEILYSSWYDAATNEWKPRIRMFLGVYFPGFDGKLIPVMLSDRVVVVFKNNASLFSNTYFIATNAWALPVDLPKQLDQGDVPVVPQIKLLNYGNNIATVWRSGPLPGSNLHQIVSSHYNYVADDWSVQKTVTNNIESTTLRLLQVLVDSQGNLTAIWTDSILNSTKFSISANFYNSLNNSWKAAPDPLEITNQYSDGNIFPSIEMDPMDNITVVWTHLNAGVGQTQMIGNYMNNSGVWKGAESLGLQNIPNASFGPHKLLTDSLGNTTLLFVQSDGANKNLRANRYSSGIWGGDFPVETDTSGSVDTIFIGPDQQAGNSLIFWSETYVNGEGGTSYKVWVNRLSAVGTLGTPELIGDAISRDITNIKYFFESSGNIRLLLFVHRAFGFGSILYSYYNPLQSNWSLPILITDPVTENILDFTSDVRYSDDGIIRIMMGNVPGVIGGTNINLTTLDYR